MDMKSPYYLLIAISRYLRIAYFGLFLQKFLNLGEGEVGSKIKLIVMTMLLIIIIFSGVFVEAENWHNVEDVIYVDTENEKAGYRYKAAYSAQPNAPLEFHHGLYYVIVTILTVGYGDINAMNEYSKACTMLLMVVTIAIVPKQTGDLLKLYQMWSVYKKIEYNNAELKHVVVAGYVSLQAI